MARLTHERTVSKSALASTVDALMPQLKKDLIRLTTIPSISESSFPPEPVKDACKLVIELLRDAGLQHVKTLDLPETYPIVTGEIPAPPGAPTVLLYGHYDVVPPGDESKWTTPPFEPAERDGAIYGRGVSDSKANVIAHVGALRAWSGKPPVGIKVIVEGMEEVGSALNQYPMLAPDQFRADAMLITDMGSLRPGTPTLTMALRGMAVVTVEVKTLAGPKHSGQFGGAAPDALIVLLHALASLHDGKGNVAVSGLRREPWTGEAYSEAEFRELAEVGKGLPLFGSAGLGEHLWSGPAITITGLDALPVDKAVNAVVPSARARINLRVHPKQDAKEGQAALVAHLKALRPFGIPLTVTPGATGDGFFAEVSGPAYEAGRAALSTAWDSKTVKVATGGSIPLVHALHTAVPDAEILLLGATDGFSNIHAPNERVLIGELRNTVLAQAEFFQEFAERWSRK